MLEHRDLLLQGFATAALCLVLMLLGVRPAGDLASGMTAEARLFAYQARARTARRVARS